MTASLNGYTANGGMVYFVTTIDLTGFTKLTFQGPFCSVIMCIEVLLFRAVVQNIYRII